MRTNATVTAVSGSKGIIAVKAPRSDRYAVFRLLSGPADVGDMVSANLQTHGKQICLNLTKSTDLEVDIVVPNATAGYLKRIIGPRESSSRH